MTRLFRIWVLCKLAHDPKKPNVGVFFIVLAGDSGGVNVNELVRVVREAALSRTEIQILTDALLNKHHDPLPEHSEWTEVTLSDTHLLLYTSQHTATHAPRDAWSFGPYSLVI